MDDETASISVMENSSCNPSDAHAVVDTGVEDVNDSELQACDGGEQQGNNSISLDQPEQ